MEHPSFDIGDIPVNLRQELFNLLRVRRLEGAKAITFTGLPAVRPDPPPYSERVPATGC